MQQEFAEPEPQKTYVSGAEAACEEQAEIVGEAQTHVHAVVLPPADIALTLTQYRDATRRYHRRVKQAIRVGLTAAVGTSVYDAIALMLAWQSGHFPFASILAAWGLDALVLGVGVAYPLRAFHRRQELAHQLIAAHDAQVIGPLAEMLASGERGLRQAAAIALLALLPHCTPDHAALISDEQRDCLYSILRDSEREQAALKIALLRALPSIGDSRALPLVERLADSPVRHASQRAVREEARQCLPLLRQHLEHEPARRILLRPHTRVAPDAASLLRAVSEQPTPPTQLLRPAE